MCVCVCVSFFFFWGGGGGRVRACACQGFRAYTWGLIGFKCLRFRVVEAGNLINNGLGIPASEINTHFQPL